MKTHNYSAHGIWHGQLFFSNLIHSILNPEPLIPQIGPILLNQSRCFHRSRMDRTSFGKKTHCNIFKRHESHIGNIVVLSCISCSARYKVVRNGKSHSLAISRIQLLGIEFFTDAPFELFVSEWSYVRFAFAPVVDLLPCFVSCRLQ